ncbi:hypothetical protein V2G26_020165 [Clonostachys chloroleuca]
MRQELQQDTCKARKKRQARRHRQVAPVFDVTLDPVCLSVAYPVPDAYHSLKLKVVWLIKISSKLKKNVWM